MGYPMSYGRVVSRNHLRGGYGESPGKTCSPSMIAGDLRRLEQDQRDEFQIKDYAARVGITEAQVKAVLDIFFDGDMANPIEAKPYSADGGWIEAAKKQERENPVWKGEPAEFIAYWRGEPAEFIVQTDTDLFAGFRELVAELGFPFQVYCRRSTRTEPSFTKRGQDGVPDQVQTD